MLEFDDASLDPIGLPGQLNFFHKRLIGAAIGFVTGGPTGAIAGGIRGGGGGVSFPSLTGRGFAPATGDNQALRDALRGTGVTFEQYIAARNSPASGSCPGFFNVKLGAGCFNPFALAPFGDKPLTPQSFASDVFGEAVVGAFGMPALIPAIVGEVNGNPIRRCPRGSVLGKDDLCYNKLPRNFRKWPRAPRAPVTAGDAKAIRRADGARGRVKKLAGDVGFTCKKR